MGDELSGRGTVDIRRVFRSGRTRLQTRFYLDNLIDTSFFHQRATVQWTLNRPRDLVVEVRVTLRGAGFVSCHFHHLVRHLYQAHVNVTDDPV